MNAAAEAVTVDFWILAFGLALARISAFLVASPLFGQQVVPNPVKVTLCIALAMFWAPEYVTVVPASGFDNISRIVVEAISEFVIGFGIGYLVRLAFLPCKIAGSYLGQEFGFNLGQVSDPSSGAPMNEVGLLFDAFAIVLFWISNIDHYAWKILGATIGSMQADTDTLAAFATMGTQLFSASHDRGILLIAPVGAIMWATLLGLMIVMKVWPQVTLFTFGMGARLLLGFVAFFYFLPEIISGIEDSVYVFAATIANATIY